MKINEGNPVATFSIESATTTSTGSSGDDIPTIPKPPPFSTTFSVEDCVYRGEGNANVVVALPKEHKVIRFRKSLANDVSPDGGKQRAEREAEFVKFMASRFLGPYTQIPQILRCNAKDLVRLSEAIRPFRPDKRRHKEISEIYAIKFPDYTYLQSRSDSNIFRRNETFCVEIKPKQGYLQDNDRKFQKCPYCLQQYYKLKKKIIKQRSTYCPFDLFSGEETRMKSALKALLKSPQNNLKIFKDGTVIYDQESSSSDLECVLTDLFRNSNCANKKEYADKFCDLIYTALLHSFTSEEFNYSESIRTCDSGMIEQDLETISSYINPELLAKAKKFLYFAGEACNLKGEALPKNSVLERILHMQRLSFVSSEYVYKIYSKYRPLLTDDIIYSNLLQKFKVDNERDSKQKKTNLESTETCIQKCPSKNVSFVSKSIVLPINVEKYNLWDNRSSTMHNRDNIHCNEKDTHFRMSIESVLNLQNYLLFSCARDCSILMSFRQLNSNTTSSTLSKDVLQLSDELSFVCTIRISDLDPKSLHCIEKHRQRDINVLQSVISILEEELVIKNQSLSEK